MSCFANCSFISQMKKENDDFASVDHKTASMVKKQPNQNASLIATNNDAITCLKLGKLNES
jgi:hypothetical protein